jgi:hypothetical protein
MALPPAKPSAEIKAALHEQYSELLHTAWVAEENWRFDDRLDVRAAQEGWT